MIYAPNSAKNNKFNNCEISIKNNDFLINSGICLSLIYNYDLFSDNKIKVLYHLSYEKFLCNIVFIVIYK